MTDCRECHHARPLGHGAIQCTWAPTPRRRLMPSWATGLSLAVHGTSRTLYLDCLPVACAVFKPVDAKAKP